jgi:putative hydrolase of the HAD superfamily
VLLFDLGGVLVQSDGLAHLELIAPRDARQSVAEKWHSSRAVDLFERGKIPPHEFAASFIEEWNLELNHSEFLALFASWVKGFFPGAESLIEDLRAKHRVAYLSNTNAVHYANLPQLSSLFDSALGVPPDNVYFFDDLEPNVVVAREAGMKAVQVRGMAELKAALQAEGLYGGRDT